MKVESRRVISSINARFLQMLPEGLLFQQTHSLDSNNNHKDGIYLASPFDLFFIVCHFANSKVVHFVHHFYRISAVVTEYLIRIYLDLSYYARFL